MKKFDIKRFCIRLKVFLKKRMRIFTKHPKRTVFALTTAAVLALVLSLMFATPLFFNATVRFETGDGSIIFDKTIRRGGVLPRIDEPELEYNTFGGWYFDKEYAEPYENQRIYSDTVLYAKWDTIFTEEYFFDKSKLIEQIYYIDLFDKPEETIIRDEDALAPFFISLKDLEYVEFLYRLEYYCFDLLVTVAKPEVSNEMLTNLFDIIEKDVIETGTNDFYYLFRADRAVFLVPYGMENIFFGDIEKSGNYYYAWDEERDTYSILRYLGDEKVLSLPTQYNNKPIDHISSYAFYYSSVEEIIVNENIKGLEPGAFFGSNLKEIDISKGLSAIKAGAFTDSRHLETIRIGKNVEYIAPSAFSVCPSLKEIIVDENNPNYKSIDGILYDKEMKKLLAYPALKEGDRFIVPQGIEELAKGSFSSNQNLQELILPDSLKIIDSIALYQSQNLKEIYIPDGVEEFGKEVFMNSSLEYVHLSPSSRLKKLGADLFYSNHNIKEFYIPQGVQTIDYALFGECENLEKITFAPVSAITQIPQQMFNNCENLWDINIPSTVQTIGSEAFHGCKSLKEIDIRSAFIINDRAFMGCNSLEDIELSSTLRYIGNRAFADCFNFVNMEIPKNADWIGEEVFANINLEKLTAPLLMGNEYHSLGYYFGGHNSFIPQSLDTFTINNQISRIPQGYFENAQDIKNIILPDSVSIIEDNAFIDCTSLLSIDFPEGLIEIGIGAFRNCLSLTQLSFPQSLVSIGDFAFAGHEIDNLMNIASIDFAPNSDISSIGSYAFSNNDKLIEISLEYDLLFMGNSAFSNNSALEDARLADIQEIGIGVFRECNSLQSLSIPFNEIYRERTPSYLAYYFDGIDKEDYWKIPHSLETVNVLAGIKSLPDYAFYRAEYIQEVNLPPSVEYIGDYSFMGIINLPMNISKVNIPNGNIKKVGKKAFQFCPLIETLNLGETIQEVGEYAFEESGLIELHIPNAQTIGVGILKGNNNLQEITVPLKGEDDPLTNSYIAYYFHDGGGYQGGFGDRTPASLKTINITGADKIIEHAFRDCRNIENINLPDSVEEIGAYAFYDNVNLQTIELGAGLQTIGQFAFSGCGLLTLNIPSNIMRIGRNAFEKCLYLERVEFAEQSQPEPLGNYAFSNCQSLKYINLPDTIYEIKEGTFSNCTSLTQIDLPEFLEYIRSCVFDGSGLEKIDIPHTVMGIEFAAFRDNINLSQVIFDYDKSRLQTIGQFAFRGCVALEEITFPESLRQIVNETFLDCKNLKEVYISKEFDSNETYYYEKATRVELGNEFDGCHEDLKIFVPEVTTSGEYGGVELYKNWMSWEEYAERIFAMPE